MVPSPFTLLPKVYSAAMTFADGGLMVTGGVSAVNDQVTNAAAWLDLKADQWV